MKQIIALMTMMTFQINNVMRLTNDNVNDETDENDLVHRTIVSIKMLMNQTSNEQRADIHHNENVRDKESVNIAIIVQDRSILLRDFNFNYRHVS
jgi:hypothetical protein